MSNDPASHSTVNRAKVAVIVAGGQGLRMQSDRPKQFLELEGRPILLHTVETFLQSYSDMQVVLVLPQSHMEEGKKIISTLTGWERVRFALGGETRFHSVQNGLQQISGPAILFVHDAVRCLLSVQLIHRCYEQALALGSAIPVINATDSIRMIEGQQSRSLSRSNIRLVQTPQTFQSEILIPAYQTDYLTSFTDEASVVEHAGVPVHLVEGEEQNIKITRAIDLVIATAYLQERNTTT
ncbi:MAG: 2-C-methyl-D-erythritol 4-phosphate cytidylyltransferase [Bacteroidota bacterium]